VNGNVLLVDNADQTPERGQMAATDHMLVYCSLKDIFVDVHVLYNNNNNNCITAF